MRSDAPDLRSLAGVLGWPVGIALVIVLVGPVLGLAVDAPRALLLAAGVGVLLWVSDGALHVADGVEWVRPTPAGAPPLLRADRGTRRLDRILASAQPDRGFTASELCGLLGDVTRHRLVSRHHWDADRPIAEASGLLSDDLIAYLGARKPRPLGRRHLHRLLKEIDAL